MICRLRYATTVAKGFGKLVDNSDLCGYNVKKAAEEKRTALLGKHRGVLRRQPEPPGWGIVLNITSCRHSPKPLTRIAFVNTRSGSELRASAGPVGRKILKRPKR